MKSYQHWINEIRKYEKEHTDNDIIKYALSYTLQSLRANENMNRFKWYDNMGKRYEALYVTPGFCDGFYDNNKKEYVSDEKIEKLMNQANDYDSMWEDKYDELKKDYDRLKQENNYFKELLKKHNIL